MKNDLISICISTYNRAFIVNKAIESAINQSYKNIEIHIIDDFSTDNTLFILKKYKKKDRRIIIHQHLKNKGLAAARNTGLNHANGKWIAFLDDDDTWDSNFIEDFFKLSHEYDEDWCFCCGTKYIKKNKINYICLDLEGSLLEYIKKGFTPPVSAQFYSTKKLLEINGFNESIKSGVDYDIWLRLAFDGIKIKSLNKCNSLPNSDAIAFPRITTDFKKRLNGIVESLNIWKNDIEKNISIMFFNKLYKRYITYIYLNFFYVNFYRRIFYALYFFLICPYKLLFIRNIFKKFINKINQFKKVIKTAPPLLG